MKRVFLILLLFALPELPSCEARKNGTLEFGFVVNASSDFWKLARSGIRQAEQEFGVTVSFQEPGESSPTEQKRILEYLIGRGVKGIAISALSPESQIGMLNDVAEQIPLICMDSDAPDSKRIAYIGTNNVQAGRFCGLLLKDVLPQGGRIAVFVGKLDSANARERIQGIREMIQGTQIEIAEVFTDQGKIPTAQENVSIALGKYSDLACLVGIWAYNGPAIAKVVRAQERKIPVVCFDENEGTLRAIEEGAIQGTVVQDPYQFGYLSIRLLARLARGEQTNLPENGLIYTPIRIVRKEARPPLILPDGEKAEVVAVSGFHEKIKRLIAEGTR